MSPAFHAAVPLLVSILFASASVFGTGGPVLVGLTAGQSIRRAIGADFQQQGGAELACRTVVGGAGSPAPSRVESVDLERVRLGGVGQGLRVRARIQVRCPSAVVSIDSPYQLWWQVGHPWQAHLSSPTGSS